MRARALGMVVPLAALLWTGDPPTASAAVRVCQPAVTSGPHEAATELDARRSAMAAWLIAAGRYSPAHANWRLAANKTFRCQRTATGFRCEAYGAPCLIEQAPRPDLKPLPPPGRAPPPLPQRNAPTSIAA